jgi:hypothetical protein
MKHLINRIVCLQTAALFMTAVLTAPAAAQHQVPFKGTLESIETTVAVFPPDVPFPTLFVEGSGSGDATHLGAYSVTFTFEVNLDDFTATGSYEFVAANGDSIFTEVAGQGTVPDEDGISFLTATHTITGGTSRFAGATGSFIEDSVLNVITHVKFGSFNGTIEFD